MEKVTALDSQTGELKETELTQEVTIMDPKALNEVSQLASQLGSMKKGVSLTTTYKEFNKSGDKARGVFVGMKTLNKKEGEKLIPLPAVGWMEETGEIFVNAGSNLVSQLAGIPQYTPIEIEFIKEEKAGAGKVKVYKVSLLNAA